MCCVLYKFEHVYSWSGICYQIRHLRGAKEPSEKQPKLESKERGDEVILPEISYCIISITCVYFYIPVVKILKLRRNASFTVEFCSLFIWIFHELQQLIAKLWKIL